MTTVVCAYSVIYSIIWNGLFIYVWWIENLWCRKLLWPIMSKQSNILSKYLARHTLMTLFKTLIQFLSFMWWGFLSLLCFQAMSSRPPPPSWKKKIIFSPNFLPITSNSCHLCLQHPEECILAIFHTLAGNIIKNISHIHTYIESSHLYLNATSPDPTLSNSTVFKFTTWLVEISSIKTFGSSMP